VIVNDSTNERGILKPGDIGVTPEYLTQCVVAELFHACEMYSISSILFTHSHQSPEEYCTVNHFGCIMDASLVYTVPHKQMHPSIHNHSHPTCVTNQPSSESTTR
jgi:hypothetical protein